MSKFLYLRAMVNQRLTAAAEDIFLLFEKAMLEFEDEMCRSKQNQKSLVVASALSPTILLPKAEPGDIPQEEKDPEEQSVKQEEEQLSVAVGVKRKASQLRVMLTSKSDGFSEHSDTDDDDQWETSSSARSSGLLPKYDNPPDGSPFANNGLLSGAGRAAGGVGGPGGVGRAAGGVGGPGGVGRAAGGVGVLGGLGRAAAVVGGVGRSVGGAGGPVSAAGPGVVGVGRGGETTGAVRGRGGRGGRPQRMQHPCPFCNKNFGTNQILQRHMKYHTGEKPLKVHLDSHLKTREDIAAVNSEDMPSAEEIAEAERNNQCPVCYKQLRNKPNLRRHMRIHTGEKPYKCSLCMKTFTQKSHLDAHLKTHREHAAFNCLICGVAFSTYSSLIEHFKTHSDVEPSTWSRHWLFKRSAAESEEEHGGSKDENQSKRQLLDSAQTDLPLTEGVPSPSPGLKQKSPETPQIKEEPEEQSINIKQEEEQLPVSVGEFITVCVKEEETEVGVETEREVRRGADSEDHTEDSSDMDDDYDEDERFHSAGATSTRTAGETAPPPGPAPPSGQGPAPPSGQGQTPPSGQGQAPQISDTNCEQVSGTKDWFCPL